MREIRFLSISYGHTGKKVPGLVGFAGGIGYNRDKPSETVLAAKQF
jgi:hypothetical protein